VLHAEEGVGVWVDVISLVVVVCIRAVQWSSVNIQEAHLYVIVPAHEGSWSSEFVGEVAHAPLSLACTTTQAVTVVVDDAAVDAVPEKKYVNSLR
jgi:hypothetical protein